MLLNSWFIYTGTVSGLKTICIWNSSKF